MSQGKFINFNLPYKDGSGNYIPKLQQATAILDEATTLLKNGCTGVGIIYSANYNQTRIIQETYFAGNWNTHTTGINQAEVMIEMEARLGSAYQALQGKMHMLPITTMNAYAGDHPLPKWNIDVHTGVVTQDLDRIQRYLNCGWDVLGWQNQDTADDPNKPYAIGGAVAKMDPAVSVYVQNFLINLAAVYQ